MTEEQWLACTDADELLTYLRGKKNNRKLRLFGCACYRRMVHLCFAEWKYSKSHCKRLDSFLYKALEISERYADKVISAKELDRARKDTLGSLVRVTARTHFFRQIELAAAETQRTVSSLVFDPKDATPIREQSEEIWVTEVFDSKAQAAILRDLFGNPFRPVTISPIWLTWNDATVIRLAQAAYDNRILPAGTFDNARLSILADALEEAGCSDEHILTHLRSSGEHYRGCFVVDALLDKN